MGMYSVNIFDSLPKDLSLEVFEDIIHASTIRIERIISKGHSSPDTGWYDQDESEWIMLVEGKATLEFESGSTCELSAGDYINIPAHVKHKVVWTDPNQITIWLAVFYTP
jgi:cupin 2 domain-containing protein